MRSHIIDETHHQTRRDLGTAHSGDVTDLGDLSERDHGIYIKVAVAALKSRDLLAIDAALARIERGMYGFCVECGDSISPARLEARLFAVLCTSCTDKSRH